MHRWGEPTICRTNSVDCWGFASFLSRAISTIYTVMTRQGAPLLDSALRFDDPVTGPNSAEKQSASPPQNVKFV